MVCHTTCVLAGTFIFSSFFMMATVDKRKITQDFMAILNDHQKMYTTKLPNVLKFTQKDSF